jgi:ComF family protein
MPIATPRSWLDAGLALFYPRVCQLCEQQRATPARGFVCPKCWGQVRFIKPPFCQRCGLPFPGEITTAFECANCKDMNLDFCSARSAVTARGVVLEAIHRYKYQRAIWFEPFLVDLFLLEALPVLRGGQWDLVVPVPLHSTKQREREFNQAERLARPLANALNLPLHTRIIRRVLPTRTQTLLTRKQRAENVQRAFATRDGVRLSGDRVILVDDVLTTGATTSACATVLRASGAGEVCVWTVARGL